MPHICSTLVLTCIDFRFQQSIHDWMESNSIMGDHDRVGIAGGVLNLTHPEQEQYRSLILKQIEISWNLHHIKKIILINHEDCGAYGGKTAFGSDDQEFSKHQAELTQAMQFVKQKFPDIEVETYFARLDGMVTRIM